MSYTSNFHNFILSQLTCGSSLIIKSRYKVHEGMCSNDQKALASSELFFDLWFQPILAGPRPFHLFIGQL